MSELDTTTGNQDYDRRIVRALRDCLIDVLGQPVIVQPFNPSSIAHITLVSEVFRLPKPPTELRLDNLLQIQLEDGTFRYLQIEVQAQNDNLPLPPP